MATGWKQSVAPLFSIFFIERWLFGNHNALLLLVDFLDSVVDDQELFVINERFRENAVVNMMGGGV